VRTSRDSVATARTPCVVALDMGYGHLRAAAAIASACGASVVDADRPPVATDAEAAAWLRARRWYEALSRLADSWYAPGARRLLDFVTAIPESGGDASSPNFAAKQLERMIRRGLGAGIAAHLRRTGDPLVATFYAPAIAADAHGAERVHLVVTDCDVNRVWVPADAQRSRITYFAPTDGAAARLRSYGVAPERIVVTGFPLPPELVGEDDAALRRSLASRLARLDPNGSFRSAHRDEIRGHLGDAVVENQRTEPGSVCVVFAVGGAGAQIGVARRLLATLRARLVAGGIRLVLVAGMRPRVAATFERWIAAAGVGAAASVLYEPDFATYYRRFNETLADADALWTKPSELTFYAALGLPLLLAQPLGVHERRNRAWALSHGAAIDARDVAATAARLPSLVADGSLAAAAWNGYRRLPHDGTRRILEAVAAS
jgi:hypothetical protein